MTEAELLASVKTGLFGSPAGTWRDQLLTVYIDEVKAFMADAGVTTTTLNSAASVGCVMVGVNDLMNYQPGGVRFSEYFQQRVTQLACRGGNAVAPESDTSYNNLTDKPTLNGTTIQGELESDDVGIDTVTNNDITSLFSNS